MPDTNETGQKGVPDIKEQARAEVRKQIEDAKNDPTNPEEAIEKLMKRLVEELKNVTREAREVVDNEKKAKEGLELFLKAEEKRNVTIKVIKIIEVIRQGVGVEKIAKTQPAQAFLEKVAQDIPSPTASECNQLAAYLTPYLLGDKDITINPPDQQKTEFQRDFEALAQVNPDLARHVKEALLKAANENKMSTITADLLNNLVIPEEETRRRRFPGEPLTEDEKEEYIHMLRKIFDLYSKRVAARQKEQDDDKKMIDIGLVFLPIKDVSLLRKLGLSDQDISRFLELRDKFNQGLDTEFLGQYTPILKPAVEQAKRDFDNIGDFFSLDDQGKITMSKEQKQAFEYLIRKYFYKGLSIIHQNTSQEFHSVLRDRMELSYYFSLIGQVVTYACDRIKERLPDTKDYEELRLYFEDKSESFMSRIMNHAQLFHNLPLYTRNLDSVEEIKKLFSFIYPSQLVEVFDDKTNLMAIARDELTMLLREYLVMNNNQYRGDLLSGEYREKGSRWSEKFKEEYKKRLKYKLRRLGLYQGEKDEWILDMLRTYSEGIGIATLIDGEILATSDPVPHIREVHPLMTLLSAKHNWRSGRGLDAPGLITRFLLGMDVDLFPQPRPFFQQLVSKKRFVPKEFYDMVNKKIRDYGGAIIDEMTDGKARVSLFGMGGLYQELISMFNLPGDIVSWNGWRVEGITEELARISKLIYSFDNPKDTDQWHKFFDLSLELYGTTSLWWQIGVFGDSRPTKEVKKLIEEKLGKEAVHKLTDEKVNDRVIKIEGQKMSFLELRLWRMNQLRGELFFRFLRRNPGDFLQILAQLCPDILDKESKVFQENSQDDKDKQRKKALEKRWGKEGFEILKKVNQWLINASQNTIDPETNKKFIDIKDFLIYFRERSSDAFERMRLKNEEARRKIIEIANNKNLTEEEKKGQIEALNKKILYLSEEDFGQDKDVWNLFAGGDNSFFKIITGLSYDQADNFFDNFGSYNKLGNKNIFFIMANNWVLRNGDINPFNSDVVYYDIYRQLPYPGESTLGRIWDANISTYKEVISQIPNLETLLFHAAESGSLKEIYELHQKVFNNLFSLVGREYGYRANYILAQIVAQFFIEHSVLRDPKWKWLGPIGWICRFLFGKNISLSKLLTHNIHAFSMDNNALRSYFMTLSYHLHVLPTEGVFSSEQLEIGHEVTTGVFIIGDIFPTLLWSISLFLFFNYIKNAFSVINI